LLKELKKPCPENNYLRNSVATGLKPGDAFSLTT
jgi:hypothetical protein